MQEAIPTPDQVGEATNYIKKLQINLEKMKEKKNFLQGIQRPNVNMNRNKNKNMGLKSPKIKIQQIGLVLEVVLITGLDSQFLFSETLRVLHEEGVDIVNASYKANEDSVFHSIHCQVNHKLLYLIDLNFLKYEIKCTKAPRIWPQICKEKISKIYSTYGQNHFLNVIYPYVKVCKTIILLLTILCLL